MDGSRFDDLTKALGARRTRRGVLGALAGAALASIGLREEASAGHCPPPRVCGGACCPVGFLCQNGTCVRPGNGTGNPGGCPAGQASCAGACVAIGSDANNCGACGNICSASADPCQVAVCVNGGCNFTAGNEGGACNDGNACTQTDICQGGICVGGNPVACSAPNDCFVAGTCQSTTGACSDPTYLGDGTSCPGGVCFNRSCCTPLTKAQACANNACGPQSDGCGGTISCLALAGDTCAQDGDCCSGVCVNGTCQAGPVATGGACDSNGDCASHVCCSGFCLDTAGDPNNCGRCGNICAFPNATAACEYGGCVVDHCDPGYTSCGGLCDTDTMTDPNHCGGCGNFCGSTQYCANGGCADKADVGGSCASDGKCLSGHCCDGACADLQSDLNNCGACRAVCAIPNATATCEYGDCVVAHCDPGFSSCGGGLCDTNLDADPDNCGACGNACSTPNIQGACENGHCVVLGCNPGYESCAGVCDANLDFDPKNCGGCGRSCPATDACDHGNCVGGCVIDGQYVNIGASAGSGCVICDPNVSVSSWTTLSDGSACAEPASSAGCWNNGTCASGVCNLDGTVSCPGGGGGGGEV